MILEIKHMAHGLNLQLILDTPPLHLVFWLGAAWQSMQWQFIEKKSRNRIKMKKETEREQQIKQR